jgi:hypothetical protein
MTDEKWQLQPNGLVVRVGSYAIRITSGPMGQSHAAQEDDLKRRQEIARMICAAPDLIEACKAGKRHTMALSQFGGEPGQIVQDDDLDRLFEDWADKTDAALRKVKGGTK